LLGDSIFVCLSLVGCIWLAIRGVWLGVGCCIRCALRVLGFGIVREVFDGRALFVRVRWDRVGDGLVRGVIWCFVWCLVGCPVWGLGGASGQVFVDELVVCAVVAGIGCRSWPTWAVREVRDRVFEWF